MFPTIETTPRIQGVIEDYFKKADESNLKRIYVSSSKGAICVQAEALDLSDHAGTSYLLLQNFLDEVIKKDLEIHTTENDRIECIIATTYERKLTDRQESIIQDLLQLFI